MRINSLLRTAWALAIAGLALVPAASSAQVVADPAARPRERPTVLAAPNGVPLVNAQTPSAAGVSRNVYRQFDVSQRGVILNNSRTDTPTQLGGWVQGNPWLAAGSARILLNEVNSSSPSLLHGFVEVAGSRAQVVIANPAGIACNGCGFINASRTTLTTGTPVFHSGSLEGFRVQGGTIRFDGAGMDARATDFTDVIARAVQVNAGVFANRLRVALGSQSVGVDTNGESFAAAPLAPAGNVADDATRQGLDVAALGGMYAGKIFLVGTEAGVGVRNAGTLGASAGAVELTVAGRLESGGTVAAQEGLRIASAQGIDGRRGVLAAGGQLSLTASAIDLSGAQVEARDIALRAESGDLALTGARVQAADRLDAQATEVLRTEAASLSGQQLRLAAAQLSSAGGRIVAGQSLEVRASGLDNDGGLLQAGHNLALQADRLTGSGRILSDGDLSLRVQGDYANSGQVLAAGHASVQVAGALVNASSLSAGSTLQVRAESLDNQAGASLTGKRVAVVADQSVTNRGLVDGSVTDITAGTLRNLGSGRIYGDQLAVQAGALVNEPEGSVAPVIAARRRLDLGVQQLDNREHALVFSAGDLALGGALDANRQATGQARAVSNHSATIEALGDMRLAAQSINNTNGHLVTDVESLPDQHIVEYQGAGSPLRYVPGRPGVWIHHDESDQLRTPEGLYEDWTLFAYTRSTSQTRVVSSDPGQILSGGALRIDSGRVLNDTSRIAAGGAIAGRVGELVNTEVAGERVVTDTGTATAIWREHHDGDDSTGSRAYTYQPPPTIERFLMTAARFEANGAGSGDRSPGAMPIVTHDRAGLPVHAPMPTSMLPPSSLFRPAADPASGYLIETDPRFADRQAWLGSDYLLAAMGTDPASVAKRLGDGFYEQRLVREQVLALTGRRFLGGDDGDEAQYRALLDNGATFASSARLRVGVALSPEQVAQLTSDIVWLVERTVTLPDGSTTRALVPQLYVVVRDGDLTPSGALIAGRDVQLAIQGDLTNGGTIAGRGTLALSAQNVRNLGGRMDAGTLEVLARDDLENIGGTLSARQRLAAVAGRDLTVASTTSAQSNANGTRQSVDRVAGLYVSGPGGTLLASAGRDASLVAATLRSESAGPGEGQGSTTIAAGRDLRLGTVTQASSNRMDWGGGNHRSDAAQAEVGTTVQAQGDIRLLAGNDLQARAASVASAQGAVQLQAGRDVEIAAGQSRVEVDEAHRHTSRGFLSSTTVTTRDTLQETTALASTVSGRTVSVQAGQDTRITGGNVASTEATGLAAGRDLTVEAATQARQAQSLREERKSGVFSSGGFGITVGRQRQSTERDQASTSAAASTVGSTDGRVDIIAGRTYRQVGSDVVAPQGDIDIAAARVDILEARESRRSETRSQFQQSGVTVAVSNPVVTALQATEQVAQAASRTSDSRMQVLAAATSALALRDAAQAVNDPRAEPGTAGGMSVALSVGSSRSSSQSVQAADQSAGSTVAAGGRVGVRATGAGDASDLTVQGSAVRAAGDVDLQADHEVRLLAARNSAAQQSSNSSSSASLGVSVGIGGQGAGVSFVATASAARGSADGQDTTWTHTQVESDQRVRMASGGDTTMRGAVVRGAQVGADVGGKLAIESLQDTSDYSSRQRSAGGSLSVGGRMGGSLGAGRTQVDSAYASVNEQSAIRAGDGGFQVGVQGDATLQGGAITSSQHAVDADRNRFSAAQLALSDIGNRASYSASGIAANFGTGQDLEGRLAPQGTSAGVGSDSGSASSVTRAGISGMAGNREARTGEAATGIAPVFDAERVRREIEAQVTITSQFGAQAGKAIEAHFTGQRQALREQARSATTPQDLAQAERELHDLGMQERALNILLGAVTGLGGAAVSREALSSAAEKMRELMVEDSKRFAGVVDSNGNFLNNVSGPSEGLRGDGVKLGGTRVDLDALCGASNERCKTNVDGSLALNRRGQVQFDDENAGMSLGAFLNTAQGREMRGLTGGVQGVKGTLFGAPYEAGSWQDKLIEAFAGTHDMVGGKLSGLYDQQGNAVRGRDSATKRAQEAWSASGAILVSSPFAAAEGVSAEVWRAIAIILRSAR